MNANVSLKVSNIKEFLARSIIVRNQMRDAKLQEALHWIENIKPFFCNVCHIMYKNRMYWVPNQKIEPLELCLLCKEPTCSQCLVSKKCAICVPGPCGYCGTPRVNETKYDFCSKCGMHACDSCLNHQDNKMLCPDCLD